MSALERTRDFAVMKATGASNGFIAFALGVQAVVLALAAGVIAIAISLALAPAVPMSVEIPKGAYGLLLLIAVVVGLLSSVAGLRRTMAVDPALAFG
jgi:putative ABC transport system permease protein